MKSHNMSFRLAYLRWILAHSKGQGEGRMHVSTEIISLIVIDRANTAVSMRSEVAYGLSVSIFEFDHGSFSKD